jgi:hypothetical protein
MRYSRAVATRSAKSTGKQAKASKATRRAARAGGAGKSLKSSATGKKKRVNPERRTTLRVPHALEAEISRVSRELGVSENQALVHLAALGAESVHREREVRRLVERRRTAITKAASVDAGAAFPSPEEMREAILIDRP